MRLEWAARKFPSSVVASVLVFGAAGCSSPSPSSPEQGVSTQAVDFSSFPVGTAWDRANSQVLPQCVSTVVSFERLNRLRARVFRVSSKEEITSKLASVNPGSEGTLARIGTAWKLAQQFRATSTDEIYVVAITFLEQEGTFSRPAPTPTQSCPANGSLEDFIEKCGTDTVSRVVHGSFVYFWVDASTVGAALPALRARLGSLNETIEVDAEELLQGLSPSGVAFTVHSEERRAGGLGVLWNTTELRSFFDALKADANAQPLGAPNSRRLSAELSPVELAAIEACVGPTTLTATQWDCLHQQLVRLTDFATETGAGRDLLEKHTQALAILERMRLEPEPFNFAPTAQPLCDSVRPAGQPAPAPRDEAAVCARNVYTYIAENYRGCRKESEGRISQCIVAVEASQTCDSRAGVVPAACQLSSRCETLLSAAAQAPTPQPRGNRPTVLPGSKVRPNRTYTFESAGNPQRIALSEEPTKDTLCFLMGFGGLFDNDDNYVNLVEGPDFWELSLRTANGRADSTRYGTATVECVDKARFGRAFWTQGSVKGRCEGLGICPLLPGSTTPFQSYSALAGIGGRWQHWADGVRIVNRPPPLQSEYWLDAVSGGAKEIQINWFAADPALVHPSLTPSPPPGFSLERGSPLAQTVGDRSSPARPVVVLPVTTDTGICFLSSVRGEFVRSEDAVLVSTNANSEYVLSVTSGWNTVDRRDVSAGAQCLLYR